MLEVSEIVEAGLCIGCGLCESLAGPDTIRMQLTDTGVERPAVNGTVPDSVLAQINQACPGLVVEGLPDERRAASLSDEPIWGPIDRLSVGHATDPEFRHVGASGGVLTALAHYVVASGRVDYVLHLKADRWEPLHSRSHTSGDRNGVLAGAGSRYGPGAVLANLEAFLDRNRPFAVVAKPCDVAALRNLARDDERVDRLIPYKLVMACGGASKLSKYWDALASIGVDHRSLTAARYRGHGNPGPTRFETANGSVHEFSYLDFWAEESAWELQWRCKVCPDGMGEVADIVSLDCWPGGAPTGEDEGFNAIITRTEAGTELYDAAVAAGALTITDHPDDPVTYLESIQPHQSRRKRAIADRLDAMTTAGLPTLETRRVGVEHATTLVSSADSEAERRGTTNRISRGVHRDPMPVYVEPPGRRRR